jgi:hypothetical protein
MLDRHVQTPSETPRSTLAVGRLVYAMICCLERDGGEDGSDVLDQADTVWAQLIAPDAPAPGAALGLLMELECLLSLSVRRAAHRCAALADRIADLEDWSALSVKPSSARVAFK